MCGGISDDGASPARLEWTAKGISVLDLIIWLLAKID